MKIMGLSNWLHWAAWSFKYFMFSVAIVAMMTLLMSVRFGKGSIFAYSDGSLVFVFLLLYAIATIAFCFAVSTFFSKGKSKPPQNRS